MACDATDYLITNLNARLQTGSVKENLNVRLLLAIYSKDNKKIEEAIEQCEDPKEVVYNNTPLIFTLCAEGFHSISCRLIEKFPSCVQVKPPRGLTLLYAACYGSKHEYTIHITLKLIELILKNGANIDDKILPNNSILHNCLDPVILKKLLQYRPDPFVLNAEGQTPLKLAVDLIRIYSSDSKKKMNVAEIIELLKQYEKEYLIEKMTEQKERREEPYTIRTSPDSINVYSFDDKNMALIGTRRRMR